MKLGLREQVKEFKNEFWSGKMRALCWAEVPTGDGSGVEFMDGLASKITQLYGEGSVFAIGWPKNPLTVVNEELPTMMGAARIWKASKIQVLVVASWLV